MTSNEMLKIFSEQLHREPDILIVGTPRSVPHGGIALDTRIYEDDYYEIICFQLYGTADVLSSAHLILKDENLSLDPESEYVTELEDCWGKELAGIGSVKVFPLEKICKNHMGNLEKQRRGPGYFGGYAFMDTTGVICHVNIMILQDRLLKLMRSKGF